MSQNLRPIGTRFEAVIRDSYHPDQWTVYVYEVVAYVRVMRWAGDTEGRMAEEVRCVEFGRVGGVP